MSGHTPGPWEVVQHNHIDGDLWLSVNQHADASGMKEWVAEIKYLVTDPERQRANARLIAAAPDLLDALRSVIHDGHYAECLNGKRGNAPDDHDNPTGARCSNRCIEFRAAIAKAESQAK